MPVLACLQVIFPVTFQYFDNFFFKILLNLRQNEAFCTEFAKFPQIFTKCLIIFLKILSELRAYKTKSLQPKTSLCFHVYTSVCHSSFYFGLITLICKAGRTGVKRDKERLKG